MKDNFILEIKYKRQLKTWSQRNPENDKTLEYENFIENHKAIFYLRNINNSVVTIPTVLKFFALDKKWFNGTMTHYVYWHFVILINNDLV